MTKERQYTDMNDKYMNVITSKIADIDKAELQSLLEKGISLSEIANCVYQLPQPCTWQSIYRMFAKKVKVSDDATISNIKSLGEGLCKITGVDITRDASNDYRDSDGVLRCKICGEPREILRDIPNLGSCMLPRSCRCINEAWRKKDEEKRLREEQNAVDRMFRYSLTDERFKESTFENYIVTEHNARQKRLAEGYVRNFDTMFARNKGLLLFGHSSTGKTFTASCIANALMKKRIPVLVTSIRRLTSASTPFAKGSDSFYQMIQGMKSVRLLVLEDLGAEYESSYSLSQVYEVIDNRYGAKKPLIATTNLTTEELKNTPCVEKRRIYERILEMCHPVEFRGPSWRKNKAKNDYHEIERILLGEE